MVPAFCIVTVTPYVCPVTIVAGTDWATKDAPILGVLGFFASAAGLAHNTAVVAAKIQIWTRFTGSPRSTK